MRAARQWYHLAGLLCALASVALHPSLGEVLFHRRDHRDQGEYPPTHNIFSVRTYEDAVTYLNKYGYLNCTVEGEGFAMAAAAERVDDLAQEGGSAQERKPLCSRQEIEVAFKQLQAKLNLKQTGLLDEETRLTMSAGRCGDIDVKQLGGSEAGAEAPPTSAYTTTTAESDTTTTAMRSTTGRTLPPETVSSSMIPRSQSTGTSTDSVTTTTEPTTTSNTTTTTEEEDRTTSMGMGSTVQEDRGSSPPTFSPSPSAPSAPSAGPPAPPARPSAPAPPPRPSAPAPVSPSTPPPPPSRVRRRAMIPGGLVPRELTADEWLADRMLLRRSQQPLLQRLIQPVEEPPASYSLYRREQILKDSIAKRESGDMVINDIEKELADEILRSGGFVRRKRTIKATEDEGPSQEVAGAARNNGRRLRDQFVSWRILPDGIGTKIPVSDQLSILGLAFRMWSEVIPLTFREVTAQHGHKVDIMIAFGKEQHFNCEKKFDGLGGELAHSCSGGCIHFDDEENYKKESKNSSDGIELLKVAVHEIGHVLGLFHNEDLHSIMYPIYNILRESQIEFELGPVDRKEIQSIYGCCKGSFDVVFDWLRRVPQKGNPGHYSYIFNSYFTRGETYWMYENNGNRTRYGDPLNITAEWPGLAANLDAYVQTIKDVGTHNRQVLEIKTYFFKNDMYYLYNDPEDRVAEGYPKTIASLNGADCNETIPDNIDASWYDVRKQAVHIFKGEWVWLVHVDDFASADGGCPLEKMRFTELFPMRAGRPHGRVLTGNVDSVYHAYRHYATYLFKGEDVWRNDCIYHSRSQNCLTYVGVWWRIWLDICDVE